MYVYICTHLIRYYIHNIMESPSNSPQYIDAIPLLLQIFPKERDHCNPNTSGTLHLLPISLFFQQFF